MICVQLCFIIVFIIMTQNQLKILSLLSLGIFAITIFDIWTIISFLAVAYFAYLYMQKVVQRHTERGLIELLPERIQQNLLHRSIFDLICDFWFFEAFRFLKLLTKPLLEPIYPDNAIQALENVSPSDKNKYLVKGIFKIMPYSCQKILLGRQRFQKFENVEQQLQQLPRYIKERDSQKNTDDQSERKEMIMMRQCSSESAEIVLWKEDSEDNQIVPERQALVRHSSKKQQKVGIFKNRPNFFQAKKNFFEMIQNSVGMIKNIIEIQTLNGRIQKISTGTIIKLTILFWIILIAQIKFSKDTRQIVLKTIYVLGGIISIFGTIGTTGALIYKQYSKQRKTIPEIEK